MSIFKKSVHRLIKMDMYPEIREIRNLCRKVLKYKKAKQFKFENVIEHFNPKHHCDYQNIINILKYWLNREKESYRRYAARIVIHMQENQNFRKEDLENNVDPMFYKHFYLDMPHDKYYEKAYNK